ncbi:MAG TPA: apolipoprotein N-acyltransferase [Verrucomicrobiales bacterium]|nr:apolipoprotein N-acyltransferase [Verrucomicrobiales bacterium]
MSWLKAFTAPVVSALLFAGAFPPFNLWWLAWLWALPLLWLLWCGEKRRSIWFGFRHGWLAGFLAFTATLWWVGHVSVPGMLALCAYLALYPAIWSGFAAALQPRTPAQGFVASLALAMLWCGLEWARSTLLTGFPWNAAAVPLVEMPGLRSLAVYCGVIGLSVLTFFFMTGIAASWILRGHRNARGRAVLMAIILATPAVLTLVTWQKTPQPSGQLEVMLVQPNVSMKDKMDEMQNGPRYDDLLRLTVEGYQRARIKPEMIVWPESAIPFLFHERLHDEPLNMILKMGPLTLITGADDIAADDAGTNSWDLSNCVAMLREDRVNFVIHGKVHLVPFGEYIPLRKQLPFLEDMLGHLIPTDFTPGKSLEPLKMDGLKPEVVPLVCFEDTIADLARRFVRDVPQILVNVTNDNWFHESPESAIHALNARWRCVELQRPMVRSANTGVTCVIDTEGRMTSEMKPFTRGVLYASVPLFPGGITFYATHGDVIPIGAGIAGLLLALAVLVTRRSEP